jgi:HEAT repeat protein
LVACLLASSVPNDETMGLKDLFKKRDDGGSSSSAAIDALVQKLSDPDPKVRLTACRDLAKLGSRAEKAVPRLHELIDDDDGDVCNAAAAAISEIER